MKTFKIKHYRIKIRLITYIILIILIILTNILIIAITDSFSNMRVCLTLATMWLLFMGILLIYPYILTRHYYRYDKDTILEIDEENQTIFYNHKEKHLKASFNEIKKIYCISFPRTEVAPYYYKILLQNGQSIIITSLVVENLKISGFKKYYIHTYNLFLPKKFIYK